MRRRSESCSSYDFTLNLDPQCIVMRGYLIKSPPLEKTKNKMARWHLRWFMLYDTKKRCDIDPLLEREIKLCYFKDEHSPGKEKPKGVINLICVAIEPSSLPQLGYDYVINIHTRKRLYHICSTHQRVYMKWYMKLKQHHIGLSEAKQMQSKKRFVSSNQNAAINYTEEDVFTKAANRFFEIGLTQPIIKEIEDEINPSSSMPDIKNKVKFKTSANNIDDNNNCDKNIKHLETVDEYDIDNKVTRSPSKDSADSDYHSWTATLTRSAINDDEYDCDIESDFEDCEEFAINDIPYDFQRDIPTKSSKLRLKKTLSLFPASLLTDVNPTLTLEKEASDALTETNPSTKPASSTTNPEAFPNITSAPDLQSIDNRQDTNYGRTRLHLMMMKRIKKIDWEDEEDYGFDGPVFHKSVQSSTPQTINRREFSRRPLKPNKNYRSVENLVEYI